jgi:hypothetical protein
MLPQSLPSSFSFKKGTNVMREKTHIAYTLTLLMEVPGWMDYKLNYNLKVHSSPVSITPVSTWLRDRNVAIA